MVDVVATPVWAGVPQIEINTVALGGLGGPANAQALALANRDEYLNQQKAPKASPIFTGNPQAPLAAMFDYSDKLANTQFVRNHMGNLNSWVSYNVNQTLLPGDCGRPVKVHGGGLKEITLPLASACPSGSVIFIATVDSGTTARIKTQGADGAARWINNMDLNGARTETAMFCSDGGSAWILVGGTAIAKFKHVAGGNGYQVFDSGMILQWGTGTSGADGAFTATWPTAFNTLVMGGICNEANPVGWGVNNVTVWGFDMANSTLTTGIMRSRNVTSGSVIMNAGVTGRYLVWGF